MIRFLSRVLILFVVPAMLPAQQLYVPLNVDITRAVTKDLFETNAVPYIQPMVTTLNATSNARFFDQAYVPDTVSSPYYKVSLNGMYGQILEDQRWYTPSINFGPRINVASELAKYGTISLVDGKFQYVIGNTYNDTLGLTTSLVRELLRDAVDSSYFVLPDSAATLFGNKPDARVFVPSNSKLLSLLHQRAEYKILDSAARAGLDTLITKMSLPPYLTLPPGVDMSALIAGVPQLEIGSLWGTELLLRFIPPVEFDRNVGKFSFWGVGLKHSISQYFPERWFDLAIQGVYQGTTLTNTVGFTGSKLTADATILSGNIHASKEVWGFLSVYAGYAYERIDVVSTYQYVLPQEIQLALGLLPPTPAGQVAVPTPEQPGDLKPQISTVNAFNTNAKITMGFSAFVGPIRLAVDYSVSRFNVLSAGLSYTFK
ncbi:MAG: hypothetical protein HQ472_09585 [Ignavibacteria bacterium]|nr:hypothetical protein [Ignavibacteria bacterium]